MESLHPAPVEPKRDWDERANREQLRHPQAVEPIAFDGGAASISFYDERQRAGIDVGATAFASVTLSGRDSSWGEFLTRNDALALRAWLDLLLHDSRYR